MTPIRVLYLEDSDADSELVQALLEEADIACELTRVETQAEFAAALEAGGFTLILSDDTLPAYDGLSALAYARERCPDLPFILVSGTVGEEARDRVLEGRRHRLCAQATALPAGAGGSAGAERNRVPDRPPGLGGADA